MPACHVSAPVSRAPQPPIGVFEDRAHLVADGEDRIERSHRVLKNHRRRGAAQGLALALAQRDEIAALEQDLARGRLRGLRGGCP